MIPNHSRYLILEYLYQDNAIAQMTLVLLGKRFSSPLAQFTLSHDLVSVYHAKGIRVFSKSYGFKALEDTIVDMILANDEVIALSYADFSYQILDPYYLKDIRQQQFNKLIIVPIHEDGNLIACALFYLNNDDKSEKFDEKRLVKLVQSIIKDEEDALATYLNQKLFNAEESLWSIQKGNQVFLSPAFSSALKTNGQAFQKKDFDNIGLLANYQATKELTFLEDKVTLYQQMVQDEKKTALYALDEINQQPTDPCTLVYCQYLGHEIIDLQKVIGILKNTLFDSFKTYPQFIYKVTEVSLVFHFPSLIDKRLLERCKEKLTAFRFIYLRLEKEYKSRMDVKSIIDYLQSTDVSSFNIASYQAYRIKQNEKLLIKDLIQSKKYQIVTKTIKSTSTDHILGNILTLSIEFSITPEIWNYILPNLFKALAKEIIDNPFIKIYASSLKHRSTWSWLKKLAELYEGNIAIILMDFYGENVEGVEYIYRLQAMGLKLFTDSSVFMNLKYSTQMPLIKGILISKEEHGETLPGLLSSIVDYYTLQKKYIIFENKFDLQHEKIYLIE